MRQIQVGGGRAMSFGKSRARMLTENQSKVTFKDVAGVDECKAELQEMRVFEEPEKIYPSWWPYSQGRFAHGLSGHRQDFARTRNRGRSRRAIF